MFEIDAGTVSDKMTPVYIKFSFTEDDQLSKQ